MARDNRVSSMAEITGLYADIDNLSPLGEPPIGASSDEDALFLIAKSGVENQKITFKNLKGSILGNSVLLTGNQTISGEKTFADVCTFQDTVFLHEVIDTTIEGDVSGYVFLGTSAAFEKIGIGDKFKDSDIEPEYDLQIEKDVLISGDLKVDGSTSLNGDLTLRNLEVTGNMNVDGKGEFQGDLVVDNNLNIDKDLQVSGSGIIDNNLHVSGDLLVENKIINTTNENINISFKDNELILNSNNSSINISDQEVSFKANNNSVFKINQDGNVLINSDTDLGMFNVSGEAYIDSLYSQSSDGAWTKLLPETQDQSVYFSTPLSQGKDEQLIEFPKTFGSTPNIQNSVEIRGAAEPILVNFSGVQTDSFTVYFNKVLESDSYVLHTQASVGTAHSINQTTSQSFTSDLAAGETSYTIEYPTSFSSKPFVSVNLEIVSGPNNYPVFGINNISETSFDLSFSAATTAQYKAHIIASR
jgi:hypothetical protein